MSASYLGDLAEDLLTVALASLAEARTGHAPPGRAWVSHNAPVVDACQDDGGQLTVHLASLTLNQVILKGRGAQPGGCQVQPVATFQVQLWRCVASLTADGYVPAIADMEASAVDLATDAWCLITALANASCDGSLSSERVEIGALAPLGPQGGAGGWRCDLVYALNDPGPVVVVP